MVLLSVLVWSKTGNGLADVTCPSIEETTQIRFYSLLENSAHNHVIHTAGHYLCHYRSDFGLVRHTSAKEN
jgi:hypothetical protein